MRLSLLILACAVGAPQETLRKPLHRVVDLSRGESQEVEFAGGEKVSVRLLEVEETLDSLCSVVIGARVKVEVGGAQGWVGAGMYHLPRLLGPVQIDCPVTRGVYAKAASDAWGLVKDARLRLWPAGSPLVEPETFVYPLKQRWFAGDTWMANEPVLVGIMKEKVYYHSGLDLGGSEGEIEVVAATDGKVLATANQILPGVQDDAFPASLAAGVVWILDDRGWRHRYSHLKTIDVKLGAQVRKGQRVGLLGKEGGSGGWSHLHYEIKSRQPSGRWGTENAYAFIWEAYRREYAPPLLAVAGPLHHRLAAPGEAVQLSGEHSRSFGGEISKYEWTFSDGSTGSGPTATRTYDRPGQYSEILKVVDSRGHVDYDFTQIFVVDPRSPKELAPRLNANYAPTFRIRPFEPVLFKVRTWNTKEGEEVWDFGDGTPPAKTRSDNEYARTVHRYAKPGHYVVRVERVGHTGAKGTAHLQVRVEDPGASWEAHVGRRLLPGDEAKSMMRRFVDGQLQPLPLPESREAWLGKREGLRQDILRRIGLDDLVPATWDLKVQTKGTLRREGYRIEKLTFESYPGKAVAALLYVPEGAPGRVPGVVSITGHTLTSKVADYLQQRSVNLALRGCAVLAYDYLGYGESKTGDHPHGPVGSNGHDLRSFSFTRRTHTALEVLDAIRALDLLAGRPEVDPDRLGLTGESGGSNTTYWTAALDPRVKLAVPVSSVTTFDYWIRTNVNWDWHQRPPGIRRVADIGTLLALHAPHPLLIISSRRGTDDQEFPLDEAEKSHQWARHVYRLLGAENAVDHYESTTNHGYQQDKREKLYAWVERHLAPPFPKGGAELPAKVERMEDLLAGLPADNKTFRDVLAEWTKPLPRTPAPSDEEARRFLIDRLGLPQPMPEPRGEKVASEGGAEFWVVETEPGVRVPGVLVGPKEAGRIRLVPGRDGGAVSRALAAGHRAFAFDPRGSGETQDPRDPPYPWGYRTSNWAWFAGRPWVGMWAADLLQAARFCRKEFPNAALEVEASSWFGWPALLAGAAMPDLLQGGTVTIPTATLRTDVDRSGNGTVSDVPGLFERLDVPQIRALWPAAQVTIKP